MKKLITLLSISILAFIGMTQASLAAGTSMTIVPAAVEISAFYNGTSVMVKGQIPANAEAVIRLSGAGKELHLKKKGKVGGFLWMNTGDVTLENAPNVYMVYTPKEITDLDNSPARQLSIPALKDRITVAPASEDKDFIVGEFIKLKEKYALYTVNDETVKYGAVSDGTKTFSVKVAIPPRMKQGIYKIDLGVVQDGKLTQITTKELKVKLIGFPAQLSKLAFGKPITHGVMAVLVAIAAGLLMGVIFRGKGGAH